LAGNDVLDPKYLSNDALREVFRMCFGRTLGDAEAETVFQRPEIYLNGALTEAKDRMGNVFRSKNPREHPVPQGILGQAEQAVPWFQFRSMIYLLFSGLSYYLGVHTRIMEVPLEEIQIYLTGRGSAMLTWLASAQDVSAVLGNAFQVGLKRAADEGTPIRFRNVDVIPDFKGLPIFYDQQFPYLKTEVALGLLETNLELTATTDKPVVGEVNWKKDGQSVSWGAQLGPEEMARLDPPSESEFESTTIGHFLADVLRKKETLDKLTLDEGLLGLFVKPADLQNLIRESADGADHVSQPIYGFELKALMKQYAKMVAEKKSAHVA
jgi:hypothetical protein